MTTNMSVRETADLFQVSTATVNRWIRAGKLRAAKTPGGRFVVDTADVLAFFADRA